MKALRGLPLSLHLSCSLPSSTIGGRPSRFLCLLLTVMISWLSSHCNGACEKPFTGGFYSLGYPFGWKNSGCGDPTLQLDCDPYYGMPLINITGHQYYIRQPQLTVNIDPKLARSTSLEEILQQGFEIEWNLSKGCENCVLRNDTCHYNTTTMIPLCQMDDAILNQNSGSKSSFIIVLVTGIGGSVLLLVMLLLVIAYQKKMSPLNSPAVFRRKRDNPPSISKVETFLHNYVDQMPTRYSYSGIKDITDNFAHRLDEGGFCVVYKGRLPSGHLVAIKRLDQSRQSETQFMNEVATIGTIHHIHLVRLLGYCFEGHTSALLYEYMANGSLDRFILGSKEEGQILNWDQLYSIALGAARGFAYLHNEC
ncbi:hypothetical protein SUGI_0116450 [Cryptomeria japonica]|nr:hypothetical protein SUGI_0116450 [Cryptomeria japonica]